MNILKFFLLAVAATFVAIGTSNAQAPSIMQPPQSQTVAQEGTATFNVTASGSPPLSYQWRKDGGDIPGATSTSLIISNVQPIHAGGYSVAVSNAFGVANSAVATLTVAPLDFTFTTNNGTITITGYTGPGGAVTIPGTINGLPVTSLGNYTFYYRTNLTHITIPESVVSIGDYTFTSCSSLTSVNIPDSAGRIGDFAFYSCTSLTNFTMGNGVTSIGASALINCGNLLSIVIPNTVTNIGNDAFAGCSGLTNLSIGTNVTTIELGAFADCSSLTSVIIPDSVGKIGDRAFISCFGLTNLTIGNGVTSIGERAFLYCDGIASVLLPDSVTNIGNYAFQSCARLASVTIGNGVINIGTYAFSSCPSLASVTMGNSVTSIGQEAFSWCAGLTNVTLGNSVTSIGYWAFAGCSNLTSVNIPDSVSNIGDSAFYSCSSLTNVTVGNGVTSIADGAFFSCASLIGIYFQGNAPSAGADVFTGDTSATVYYQAGTTGWGATFGGRPTVMLNPETLFTYTTNGIEITITGYTGAVGAVTIPSTINGLPVTGIGVSAFAYNLILSDVTIPDSVINIAYFAFESCFGLTNIAIGANVTSIRDFAFYNCIGLTSVLIPSSVTNLGGDAFGLCENLTAISVEASNPGYCSAAGVLYDKGLTILIQYPASRAGSAYGISNSVVLIGKGAFSYSKHLASVTIPPSVSSIGDYAFISASLTSVTIPSGVTNIGFGAFQTCSSLTSVTIPDSVTSIGGYAFYGCDSLTAITVDALNPSYSSVDGVWFNKNQSTLIQCPGGKTGSYAVPNSVTSIGDQAFDRANLTSVTIPDSVITIGDRAFYTAKLTSVTIPNSVTNIGNDAFVQCLSLTNVTIGNGVTNIGDYGFAYCSSLTGVYFQGNAPSLGGADVFHGANNATVYYQAGTTGWGATFGGRPTVMLGGGTAPSISAQPTNVVVNVGGTAQFVVEASGTTPLLFQWYRDTTPAPGIPSSALVLTNVQLADAGNYFCIVSNAYGVATSAVATLTAIVPPRISGTVVAPGDTFGIVFTTVPGMYYRVQASPDRFVWTDLTAGMVASGSTMNFMDTNPAPKRYYRVFNEDQGVYSVNIVGYSKLLAGSGYTLVANPFVTADDSINALLPNVPDDSLFITVGAAGLVTDSFLSPFGWLDAGLNPATTALRAGEGAIYGNPGATPVGLIFTGEAPEGMALNYQLSAGLTLLSTVDPQSFLLAFPAEDGDQLFTWNAGLQTYDTFTYFAGVWDPAQPILSESSAFWIKTATARNWVQGAPAYSTNVVAPLPYTGGPNPLVPTGAPPTQPPTVTSHPQNQIVIAGSNATFTVSATGTPPLYYQWRFNGGNLPDATNSILTLADVLPAQAGNYAVVVSNAYGSVTSAVATLTVDTPIPAPPGLVAWWPGNGNALDYAGTNHGTLANGATFALGKVGQAFGFSGSNPFGSGNSVVVIPDSPALHFETSDLTLEAWIKCPPMWPGANGPTFLSKQGYGGNYPAMFLSVSDIDGTLHFAVTDYSGWINGRGFASSSNRIDDDQWHHVAGVRVSSGYRLFVDGEMVAERNEPARNADNSAPLLIGAALTGFPSENPYRGLVDEPAIYNRALSSNEIAAIYSAGIAGKSPAATMVAQPQSQTVLALSSATLSVTAAGAPPFGYQWQRNGINLPDATNSNLTLSNVLPAMAGNYSIVVSNAYGSTASSNAVLAVVPVVAWGYNTYGQANLPLSLTNVVAISAGGYHNLALKADGTVVAWGAGTNNTGSSQSYGQSMVPAGLSNVIAVSAGGYFSLALKTDGHVVAWGRNLEGQINVPPSLTNAVAISAGGAHCLALKADGSLVAWGLNNAGQTSISPGLTNNIVAISAQGAHNLVLKSDGTIVAWGESGYDLMPLPADLTNVVAICAGGRCNSVLKADGMVVAWGQWWDGAQYVPVFMPPGLTNVAAISMIDHELALKTDGTVVAWGLNEFGGCNVPTNLTGATAIAAGWYHSLALVGNGSPAITVQPFRQSATPGASVSLQAMAAGNPPLSYQWKLNGTPIAGATSAKLDLSNVASADRGFYSVIVSNSGGITISSNAYLEVLEPPVIIQSPVSRVVFAGGAALFKVAVVGPSPLTCQWLFNGTPIAGANQTNLIISPVAVADAGNYAVAVSNSYGTTISSPALLEVRYQCVPMSDGMVAWWEAESNALDTVGINHGYLTNGAAYVLGKRGYAFSFDGLGAHVRVPGNGVVKGLAEASAEAWVRPRGAHGSGVGTVFAENTALAGARLQLAVYDDGRIYAGGRDPFTDNTNSAPYQVISIGTAPLHQWSHLVAAWKAGEGIKLYVNGQLDSQLDNPGLGALSDSASSFIGIGRLDGLPGQREDFNGDVDEMTLYGRALSADEILRLYRADAAGKCNPPSIGQQPQGMEAPLGGNATFSVTAKGVPPLRYQWRHNGQPLPGFTNAAITLTNIQLADAGGYSVVVQDDAGSTRSATAVLRPMIPDLPFADNFADSYRTNLPLAATRGYGRGANIAATREPGEPLHAGKRGSNSVWITLVSPVGGFARVNTAGSSFDTLLGVYTGSTLGQLTPRAGDDDNGGFKTSEVAFDVEPGQEYHIAIDGFGRAAGGIVLSWEFVPSLTRLPQITNLPTDTVVGEGGTVDFALGVSAAAGVQWFRNGEKISTASQLGLRNISEFDVGTYKAVVVENGIEITLQSILVQINKIDGRTDPRFMARDKFLDSFDASLIHRGLVKQERRPFDRASGPTRGYVGTQVFNTYGATAEEGEPIHGGIVGGASEWFTYQAPDDGRLTIHTGGSDFDTILAVYYVPGNTPPNDFSELVNIAFDNNSYTNNLSILSFDAVEDMIYYVVVDGVAGATGIAKLNYELTPPPSLTGQPASQIAREGETVIFNATATGTNLHYQWQFNGGNLAAGTNATWALTNAQTNHSGNYWLVVTNDGGAITSSVSALTVLGKLRGSGRPVVTNGQFRLVFENVATDSFLSIQGSTNLANWFTVWSNKPAATPHEFLHPASSNRLFFRAAQGK